MRILVVGGGAREHAIAAALARTRDVELFCIARNRNPGLLRLAVDFDKSDERNVPHIVDQAKRWRIDLAVIGHENALDAGVVDQLIAVGIKAVGPTVAAAQLEMSKLYLRRLMDRYEIPGQVSYRYFEDADLLAAFLHGDPADFALKPLGLTGGKGVKVMGQDFDSKDAAIAYGRDVIGARPASGGLLLEERLTGPEFTLQAFTDGFNISPMPLVQDFKRAFEGDRGPNTGSMGSYSQPDGLLPFVTPDDYRRSVAILERIIVAIRNEGTLYKGIIYGQFMHTSSGIKLIEINARFGDPEAANVLPLLKTDFVDVCLAVVNERLRDTAVVFHRKATVCKYIAPEGYPDKPLVGTPIELDQSRIENLGVKIYFARLDESQGQYLTTTSRALALVGVADTISEAEAAVESALAGIRGRYHVRHDIGKTELINKLAPANGSFSR